MQVWQKHPNWKAIAIATRVREGITSEATHSKSGPKLTCLHFDGNLSRLGLGAIKNKNKGNVQLEEIAWRVLLMV